MSNKWLHISKAITAVAMCSTIVLGMWVTDNAYVAFAFILVPLMWDTMVQGDKVE